MFYDVETQKAGQRKQKAFHISLLVKTEEEEFSVKVYDNILFQLIKGRQDKFDSK